MENNNCPFVVGQKVVCLRYGWSANPDDDEVYPEKDKQYHIRALDFVEGMWYVRLEEIVNKVFKYMNGWGELMFDASNFAPLHPSYENISSSLAKEAMEGVGDKADSPVREIKQPVKN